MKKVFIVDFDDDKYKPKVLFPLVRPFLQSETHRWEFHQENLEKWNCSGLNIEISSSLSDADFVLVSEPLNHQADERKYKELANINRLCSEKNILAYVYIGGDYGKIHPPFSNIVYYRLGGFKTKSGKNNKAFFPVIRDFLKEHFKQDNISVRKKTKKPTVGFCGHASNSLSKFFYEKLKFMQINLQRASSGDFIFEPLFSSAFERFNILKNIDKSKDINSNFIFREKYRAGAVTKEDKLRTTIEYYNNIVESDYVICLRGGGNFSIRLYETLMMGRIPVFINTDCSLPLEDEINWKKHAVWVEWKDRKNIADIILDFHRNISEENFIQIQKDNRKFWESYLTVKHYLENISKAS